MIINYMQCLHLPDLMFLELCCQFLRPVSKFTHHVLLTLITSSWFPLRIRQTRDRGCDVPLIHPACAQGNLCLGNLHKSLGLRSSRNKNGIFKYFNRCKVPALLRRCKELLLWRQLGLAFLSFFHMLSTRSSGLYPQPTPQIPHLLLFDITL